MPETLNVIQQLQVGQKTYHIHSLKAAEKAGFKKISQLPLTLKILMENLLRRFDGKTVTLEQIASLSDWVDKQKSEKEVSFNPVRVLMQDFTGVPAIVDLAAMREAMVKLGGDATKINPLSQVDLVIDHSVQVDDYASAQAFATNVDMEYVRNNERYAFLGWAQQAFSNFRVVPPGTGICHQVNLEYLGKVIWSHEENGKSWAYPDTLVGTDSHTTMINGLSILGWGVGGIEAEAAMLGQPMAMLIPEVIGFKLQGSMREGVTATDLVLTVTQILRRLGVVGKFVEFFGSGLDNLPLPDRATIANMSPEYGATCCFFPIDDVTLHYMRLTGRNEELIALVEAYAKEQGLWRNSQAAEPRYTQVVELDLATIQPSLAGPTRPQDKINLSEASKDFKHALESHFKIAEHDFSKKAKIPGTEYEIGHGSVVIGAITSCTNTSNPSVMVAAGLVAKKAREKGLETKPWVKTSLAPGSKVVTDYLEKSGLQKDLDALGFNLVGYGCTTCIGNSGPLPLPITEAIHKNGLVACSVLSGNRNFEGRINPDCKANYLASPPLVVAYSLAGTMQIDFSKDPIGHDPSGKPVYLKDIWPSNGEIADIVSKNLSSQMFKKEYADVFEGDEQWKKLEFNDRSSIYHWNPKSTYVKNPPYFVGMNVKPRPQKDIKSANILAILGDSITTDHISPAGSIKKDSPAGKYLLAHGIPFESFNSYGSRRGNHEVMVRGTFANIRLKNEMVPGTEGGVTRHIPTGEVMPIFDASALYFKENTPLIVVAGKEYGSGSSRDWAAKGPLLLGIRAVIAESFERIHRSNLIGMGILPLQFSPGITRKTLNLVGDETFDILGIETGITPKKQMEAVITRKDGSKEKVPLICNINTKDEVDYYNNGGILPYVLRKLL